MIYDCFQFHSEVDLLEIRLEELNPYVNRFILVEAMETHSGLKKESTFLQEKGRFEKYLGKITHIIVPSLKGETPRLREEYQRNQIFLALAGCADDDLIMYSDLDEIIRGSKIAEFDRSKAVGIFVQTRYDYFLNGHVGLTRTSAITTYGFLRDEFDGDFEKFRLYGNQYFGHPELVQDIPNGGWHFTYCGGVDAVIEKVKSLSASEFCTPEFWSREWIEQAIDLGCDLFKRGGLGRQVHYVPIDESFPKAIYRNPERYKHLIKEVV